MRRFRIGSLFGIPIELDLTFLIVIPIFAYLIGSRIEDTGELLGDLFGVTIETATLTAGQMPWIVGTAGALGLFVGVVLHELGHSLVARRFGYPIDSITLWIFGGIAQFSELPRQWSHEFLIAIAGPIVSVLVGAACYGGLLVAPAAYPGVGFVLAYLAVLNVALAGFNLLPAFPMDGGRVLRAVLARNRPFARATSIAAEVGKAVAIVLGLVGILSFNWILAGVALFVYIAASSEAKQVLMRAAFQGVTVGDLMTSGRDLHTVSPELSVRQLLERMFTQRHTGYPVVEGATLVGLITLEDARAVPDGQRGTTPVGDAMTTDLVTVQPGDDVMGAIEAMGEAGVGRLPVTDGEGGLVGLISRTDVMRAFDVLKESGPLARGDRERGPDPTVLEGGS